MSEIAALSSPHHARAWRVLDSRSAYADPWVSLRTDRVQTEDGHVLDSYHVVEYPDWTSIVALTEADQRLILVREYRHGVGGVLIGLPGGLVDASDGVTGLQAAKFAAARELREETGYRARAVQHLLTTFPNPSNQNNTAYVFFAEQAVQNEDNSLAEPGVEVFLEDFVSVLQRAREGRLTLHAIHVAALWSAAAAVLATEDGTTCGALPSRLRNSLGLRT